MNETELEPVGQRFTGPAEVLFDQAGYGLLMIDPLTERVLDANRTAQRLTEFSRAELLEMALRTLIRHEHWHDWTPPLLAGAGDGKDGFQLRTRHPERWIPVRLGMTPVPVDEEETVLLVRLTDRREGVDLERRTQSAETDLRRVLASASECLWSCRADRAGRWTYRYLSPAILRLTGRPAGDFLGAENLWPQLVHPEDLPTWQAFRDRLGAGQPGALEYRLRRPDGMIRVRESVVIAPDEGGLLLHGVIGELREHPGTEDTLADESRTRVEGHARVLGTLSHDFNNLITGILGFVGLSRLGSPGETDLLAGINQIETIAVRAAELCRHLGTCTGRSSSPGHSTDILSETHRIVAALEPVAAPARLQVLSDGDTPAVAVDPHSLGLLVEELLRNAIQARAGNIILRLTKAHSPVGGAPNWPLVFAYQPSDGKPVNTWVCLQVQDDGPGLPDEARHRLGEPFFTTRQGHRGLGLSSVLGIARGHRGVVHVHSRRGAGTCVSLALPAANLPPPPPTTIQATTPAQLADPDRPLVLLAEDEQAVRDVVARLLISAGCAVVTASNGEEAIDCFTRDSGTIRLALIDISMPRLGGEKVARELRRLSADLPIVLMSGYPEQETLAQLADVSLSGYLQKPFRLPAVLDLIARVLGR